MYKKKKRLLILGAGGLLGSELIQNEVFSDWELIGHGRAFGKDRQADMSRVAEAHMMLDAIAPDAIINLIGLTDVDYCEIFPNQAYIGNVKTLETIISWMKTSGNSAYLIHISTDQVYDGLGPHSEMNVALKNYYAFSKYAGELVAESTRSVVLRTNFFGKSKCTKRKSLTDWLYNSLSQKQKIQVFEDVFFSPLSMRTLAEIIDIVLQKRILGIYNLGSHEGLSKADFAFYFANEVKLKTNQISRTTTEKVNFLKTYRPKDMRMDVSKFEKAVDVVLPCLIDEIKRAAKEYKNET